MPVNTKRHRDQFDRLFLKFCVWLPLFLTLSFSVISWSQCESFCYVYNGKRVLVSYEESDMCVNLKFRYFRFHMIIFYGCLLVLFKHRYTQESCCLIFMFWSFFLACSLVCTSIFTVCTNVYTHVYCLDIIKELFSLFSLFFGLDFVFIVARSRTRPSVIQHLQFRQKPVSN